MTSALNEFFSNLVLTSFIKRKRVRIEYIGPRTEVTYYSYYSYNFRLLNRGILITKHIIIVMPATTNALE